MLRKLFWLMAVVSMIGCENEIVPEATTAPRPARLIEVSETPIQTQLQFVGEVAPAQTVDLGFEIDGTLQSLPVNEGEPVQQGQIVAQLDPRRAQLALDSARAEQELAEKFLLRTQALRQSGTASEAELDEAIARAKLSRLAVATAQKHLDDTVLTAPFDGKLINRLAENFSTVSRMTPIVRLMPLNRIEVVVGVPEQLMARVDPAKLNLATVRFSADPTQGFAAEVLDYEAQANSETQTFDIRFSLLELPLWPVLPGMTATLELTLQASQPRAIHVPISALQTRAAGEFYVWVVSPETAQVAKRDVQVGIPERDEVAILSGLSEGELVVAAGGAWLSEGIRVRPLGGR